MKTVNPSVKKNEKKFAAFYNKDSFAVLSLQLYNSYLKSNAYVTALGNFNPAARPEILFSIYKTGVCAFEFMSIDFSCGRLKLLTWLYHAKI